MKLFVITDIHGSTMCFKKFLNALDIYKVDIGILFGDLSGKTLVPIIELPGNRYEAHYMGTRKVLEGQKNIEEFRRRMEISGYYPVDASSNHDFAKRGEEIYNKAILERLEQWLKVAEERLETKMKEKKIIISVGNDDPFETDKLLEEYDSEHLMSAENRKVTIPGEGNELVGLSYSNPTPWNTARECSESELGQRIDNLVRLINDIESAIFMFHVPPYGTPLDLAPKLSGDLTPSVGEMVNVGSIAVKDSIEKYQPMLGLHGHIHESKGIARIGRTLCINPGSDYSEGVLNGVIVSLKKGKVESYTFTSG